MKRLAPCVLRGLFFLALLLASLSPVSSLPAVSVPEGLQPMPPHPGILEKLHLEDSSLAQAMLMRAASTQRRQGIDQPALFPTPPAGIFNLLAVAVQFSDRPASVAVTVFDNLLFAAPGSGSVTDYYRQVSYAALTLVTVNAPSSTGWVTATRPYNGSSGYVNADGLAGTADDYGWGTYPLNLQGIVSDVIPLIDPVINFAHYDNDGDGFVDSVIFIHAGPGAEITLSASDVWSAAWNMSVAGGPGPLVTQDGVSVDNFTFDPEYILAPGDQTIGTYCHELGHTLFGLPDLYDPDGSSYGVGYWSLMGTGGWNGPLMFVPWIGWISNGASPAWPDAWSRMVMGFEHPLPTDGYMPGFIFPPVWTGPGFVVRLQSPQMGPKEYFLLENRQQMGFDSFLPGAGLLIWHVDEDKWNRWEYDRQECTLCPKCQCPVLHYLLALEQGDGLLGLEKKANAGDGGDPFPGTSGNTTFGFGTTPESGSYYASPCPSDSCVSVKSITVLPGPPPSHIRADLNVVCQAAGVCVNVLPASQIGWGQAGTAVTYRASVQNCGPLADTFALSANGPWATTIYDVGTGQPVTQTGSISPWGAWYAGITVTVPSSALPGASAAITLSAVSSNSAAVSTTALLTARVPYPVLLVDDDRGMGVQGAYVSALTKDHVPFDYWDTGVLGSPGLSALAAHRAVIWFTGSSPSGPLFDTLSPPEEIAMARYLDQGGQLFFCSQDYLWDIGRSAFSREYLRVATYTDDTGTGQVQGMAGDPVGGGMGTYPLLPYATWSDQINPISPASAAFVDQGGLTNGLTYDSGTWKVLFLAWPFENLVPPDAEAVMASAMEWFGVLQRVYLPLVLRAY